MYFKYLFMPIQLLSIIVINIGISPVPRYMLQGILTWTVADTPTVAIFVGSECRGTGQCLLPLCPGLGQVATGDQLKQK